MSKQQYVEAVLQHAQKHSAVNEHTVEAALIFWHCKVPLEEAKQYIQNLNEALSYRRPQSRATH